MGMRELLGATLTQHDLHYDASKGCRRGRPIGFTRRLPRWRRRCDMTDTARIGVVSDTHGPLPQEVFDLFSGQWPADKLRERATKRYRVTYDADGRPTIEEPPDDTTTRRPSARAPATSSCTQATSACRVCWTNSAPSRTLSRCSATTTARPTGVPTAMCDHSAASRSMA